MRLPTRIHSQHPARKLIAGVLIALLVTGVALIAARVPGLSIAVQKADWVFYDTMYRLRPITDRTNGPIVIVAVDQRSLDYVNAMNKGDGFGWPWPREFWGKMVTYFQACGAKAVVFDIVFSEKSVYRNELDDDTSFGKAVNEAKVPVVFGTFVNPDGSMPGFAPKVDKPTFGAANIGADEVFRTYVPGVGG